MELHRRSASSEMSPSPGRSTAHASAGVGNQGLATLLVMIAVLAIIILFCCFAAPGIRDICRKLCRCKIDDPDREPGGSAAESATIILLPYGRMLVVDRSVYAQYDPDGTGIDFMELSAELIREHNRQQNTGSTPSILDSEATSKGLSPTSLGLSPPAYEDIFGSKNWDLPPSYSELSIMLRTFSIKEGGQEGERVTVQELNAVNSARTDEDEVVNVEGERDDTIVDVDVCERARESSL